MALRAITPYIPTAEAGGFTARFGKAKLAEALLQSILPVKGTNPKYLLKFPGT